MADDSLFLTETRHDVLAGDYNGADNVRRTHESRIRSKSRLAISELTEVARSQAIDTTEVIDPEELAQLVAAVMTPDFSHTSSGGIAGPTTSESDARTVDLTDDFRLYRDDVYFAISEVIDDYPSTR